jgi:dTDP-4-dehydrorhamnose reductase
MEKLLIIGVSGLTGYKLAKLSTMNYEVYGTYNKRPINIENCEIHQLDKTNKEKTYSLICQIKPDVIIDCSALHNVDYCETHEEETWMVNVTAPSFIADFCREIGARMVYISTDYVFDGTARSYNEESKPNPLNYYYAIARTSLVFGWNPGEIRGEKSSSGKTMNFVIWALNKLRESQKLNIVSDQYSTPTLADNLADYLLALASSNVNGIFNTVGEDCMNRYDFTFKIAEEFNINKKLITPVTSDMFKQVAKRPMKCCLDSSKGKKILNIKPLSVEESLNKMKQQERSSN